MGVHRTCGEPNEIKKKLAEVHAVPAAKGRRTGGPARCVRYPPEYISPLFFVMMSRHGGINKTGGTLYVASNGYNEKDFTQGSYCGRLASWSGYASRAVQFHPHGGQSDFVWLSARTPHGGASYVW